MPIAREVLSKTFAAAALAAALGHPALAQPPRPTVDVYVREQAGLPASSARGEIEVVEVGHTPLDKVLSIVGHRTTGGWRVSYVCAQSPGCDPKKFMLVKEFDLAPDVAGRVDGVLDRLRAQPDAQPPAPSPACGQLAVAVDDRGFKRRFRRACVPDKDLGELESLLKAGLP
jgi:hypothetical protein